MFASSAIFRPATAAVLGDPTQIHQVVMNLCTNAMQAMKSEGTLAVDLDAIDLSESLHAYRPAYCRAETMCGSACATPAVGIAPHVLERMFDPFFTTKGVGVGTGLGLSLVHGIVTDLGGGVDVQSTPGAGATFTVYLPRQGRVAAPAVALETIASGQGETILLVDDEEALVKVGEEMLADARLRAGGLRIQAPPRSKPFARRRSASMPCCPTKRCPT